MAQWLKTADADFEALFGALLTMKRESAADVNAAVAEIIANVFEHGDRALIDFTSEFDRHDLTPETLRFSQEEIRQADAECPDDVRAALELAAQRIIAYHQRQLPVDERYTDDSGVELGHRWTALEAVGLYVPGGLAAYPSSVLMNAIPARVAGVERLVMVVPTPNGVVNAQVLTAARIAGVSEIYRVGGAQAIAALAFGTDTIAPVAKIAT